MAYVLVKFLPVGIAVLGGAAGMALGFLVMNTFQVKNEVVFWIVVSVCAVAMAGVSFKARD